MANSKFETELLIKAGVQGLETIAKLGKQIEAAGLDVAKLSSEGQQLNKTFREIEQKQQLITQFKDLKKATADTAGEWQQAQEKVRTLKQAMDAQGTASKAQIAAYKQATTEAKQLKQKHGELTQSLQQTRTAMKDAGVSTKNLTAQEQTLQTQSRQAQQSLTALNNEARKLSEIAKAKITLGIDKDDKVRKQIEEATKAYELLKKEGNLTSKELARANERHTQKVQKLEQELGKTKPTLSELASELGKLTSSAAGLSVLAKSAMSFEQAMAGVKKTVDGTPEQIQSLSAQIKSLSVELGLSSEAVAEIAAQGGQLGIPIEKLGEFTEMAGKMAVAFDMTAEEAADAAAKLANVFGIPITEVESLGDAINTLGNNMAAKEKEIVAAMLRIGGSAKQFGLAEEQAASLAASFIALGKPPEVAATAINALLSKLQTAQGQTAKFQGALESIGISANQMAANISDNPQKALSDFLARLSELDDKQRSMVMMELFGQEYADDISLLVGSLETYNQALDLTANKTQNAGAMNKEFDAQMQTTGKAADQAKQSLWVLAQTLGEHLLPIIATTAGAVGDVVGAVNEFAMAFPRLTQFAVLLVSGLTALTAFRSALKLAGSFGLSAGMDIAKGFTQGAGSINLATGAATKFNMAMDASLVATGEGMKSLAGYSRQSRTFASDLKGLVGHMTTLNGLMMASAGWEIGTGIGDWLYENSENAKVFGDELGRALAYLDAIFTDRTFEDVNEHFETSAETARRLAEEEKKAAEATKEHAQTTQEAAIATAEQAYANQQLANDIKVAQANVEIYTETLAQMEREGKKNTQAYIELSEKLATTQAQLDELNAKASSVDIGNLLKTDLEKASAAFEALGLDADEFATGLNSKTTTALNAFVEVARLAEGDVNKLARAYTTAQAAAGDNAQAQSVLERNLMQVTEGNKELAESVKQAALAQQNAKLMSDEQAAALDKLGISMQAVNQSMSQSGLEMVNTLKTGIAAIKEQATSAESLKVALKQALDTSLAAAKTQADFKAIKAVIDEAGLSGRVTAEQMAKINAGAVGGSDAVQRLAEATKAHTTSVNTNTQATAQNTTAKADNAKATEDIATSFEQVSQSAQTAASSSQKIGNGIMSSAKQGIDALDKLNAKLSETVAWNEKVAASAAAATAKREANNKNFLAAVNRQHAQYGTLTGIEGFLKSAGLSQEKAFEEARKLMARHGKNGRINWASAMGNKAGMPATGIKSPSAYLLELAEQTRKQQADTKRRDEFFAPKNVKDVKDIDIKNIKIPQSEKTITVNLNFDGKNLPMNIDADKETLFMDFVKRLQADAKRQAR